MNQQRANLYNNNFRNSASILDNGSVQQTNITNTPLTAVQPPIPSRRQTNLYQPYSDYRPYGTYFGNSYGSNWNYGGRYNGYGYNPYSGYSPFSQNQWSNPSGDAENRFVQYAEESTRPAFQSIEAMVHTFSSMTMMLESTFFAMTSSFRAILGVAENMGKLRSMLSQFIQTFTLFRFFKWIYWKVKYILGLRGQDMNNEILWRQTITEVLQGNGENRPSSWPIFLFLTLIFATPYLMHRLFKNAKSINFNNPKEWMQCKEPVFTATALYDFNGATPEELSLKTGQKIWLAPKSLQPKNIQGWWRATDSINVGLIPSSYVTIVGQLKKKTEVSHTNIASNIEGQDDLRENYQSEENKKYEMDEIFQLTKDSN